MQLEQMMTSTEKMSLWVAILAIVGGCVTTVLSGKYQMEGAQAQIQKDVRLTQVQTLEKKEQAIREKFEALMVEVSDLISYMDANNPFPVSDAKDRLSKCRRAAFALSAYAGPSLSHASLAVVETTNAAFDSNKLFLIGSSGPSGETGTAATGDSVKAIAMSAAKLREEFDREVLNLSVQRRELVGAL